MSDLRKLVSITLISLLVSIALLGSGWITQEVSAVDLNSAVDLEAAPHFRDLTYTVGEPSYSTSFDALGDWKVSIGNPRLAIVQSTLSVIAPSSSMVRMTLTAGDAPGLNESERSTIQVKVIPSNVTTAYTNVTLAASSDASDHVTVSFHGGEAMVIHSYDESTSSAVLFSPVEDGTPYIAAFELAEAGATVYLYDGAGEPRAHHGRTQRQAGHEGHQGGLARKQYRPPQDHQGQGRGH